MGQPEAKEAESKEIERKAAINKMLSENRLFAFMQPKNPEYPEMRMPNPPQAKLLAAWKNPAYKVFTYTGGNRGGKCVTYQTLIETPNGEIPIGTLFENQHEFDVYAWDGEKKVVAKATPPFKKDGLHECFRITMSDGRWIEAADHHRVLTTLGWQTVHQLYTSWNNLPKSKRGVYLSTPFSSDGNLSERPSGCQGGYFVNRHLCDALLRPYLGNDLISPPLRGDVQRHCVASLHGDGREGKHTNIGQQGFFRLSILDDLRQNVALFFEFLNRVVCNTLLLCFSQSPIIPQSFFAGTYPPQPFVEFSQLHREKSDCTYATSCLPYVPPLYFYGNHIISIKPIGVKSVYDFSVEKYHNYFAGGLIHHNTFLGGLLAVCTMIGEYPWNGEKIPFSHKEPRKIRYVGQAWESHVKAVVEPMLKFWWPKSRPLDTKKNNQGIEAIWIDKRTKSSIEIMSNVQDSSVFEGWNGDLVIYDEPPKRDVRVACARGLIDRGGRELFCMTLLKEAWVSREVIKALNADGSPDMSVFNVNMDIYSNIGYGLKREDIEQFAKTLTEAEKKARLDGHPAYLETLVFPKFHRHTHVKDAFKIPLDWIVDVSIDFHPSKKWAVVFMATAKNGIKYICDEIWENGNPKYIAEEIIRRVNTNNYRVGKCIIDPLAKGDGNNDNTVYEIMQQTLGAHNIPLEVASKDKDNGISMVNNLLMTENELPGLYYFKTCHKSIQETEDLMFNEETFKPEKKDDDFTECIYRLALLDTQWFDEKIYKLNTNKSVIL